MHFLVSSIIRHTRCALVTGVQTCALPLCFGRDTAETLHDAGHTVYASMRGAQGKNREAAEALRKLGIKTVELDVSDDASVEAAVKNVLAEAGKIRADERRVRTGYLRKCRERWSPEN